jgi:aryl-alcohol dehydrogenase-like predicted oxidoreductase
VSEWSVPQIDAAISFCERWGLHPPVSDQPRYSLLWRYPEREVFPYCQAKGMGQIAFSPLAHGVLTGKYHADQPPSPDTRAADPAKNQIMMSLYFKPDILRKVEAMADLAKSMGVLASQLAYAWVLHNPAVSTALIGATSLKQLQENLKALEIKIEPETATRLGQWFPIQPVAVPAP